MDLLRQDLRLAFRSLGRRPWFAAAITLMIAIGIGVNAAIFSVVDAVLLKPLAIPAAERMVMLWGRHVSIGREVASLPDYQDWKTQTAAFDGMTSMATSRLTLAFILPSSPCPWSFYPTSRASPVIGLQRRGKSLAHSGERHGAAAGAEDHPSQGVGSIPRPGACRAPREPAPAVL